MKRLLYAVIGLLIPGCVYPDAHADSLSAETNSKSITGERRIVGLTIVDARSPQDVEKFQQTTANTDANRDEMSIVQSLVMDWLTDNKFQPLEGESEESNLKLEFQAFSFDDNNEAGAENITVEAEYKAYAVGAGGERYTVPYSIKMTLDTTKAAASDAISEDDKLTIALAAAFYTMFHDPLLLSTLASKPSSIETSE